MHGKVAACSGETQHAMQHVEFDDDHETACLINDFGTHGSYFSFCIANGIFFFPVGGYLKERSI